MSPLALLLLAAVPAAPAAPATPAPAATASSPATPPMATLNGVAIPGTTLGSIADPGLPHVRRLRLVGLPITGILLIGEMEGETESALQVKTLSQLLLLLTDPRLAPFWPPMIERAGPDLTGFRETMLEHSLYELKGDVPPEPPRNESERQADSRVLALLHRYDALCAAGQDAEALAEIKAATAAYAAAAAADEDQAFYEFLLRARVAARMSSLDPQAGIAFLLEGEANPSLTPVYRINYWMNRAALLLLAHRPAEALALVDASVAARRKLGRHAGATRYAGAQYSWVRACALKGVGRDAEAAQEFARFPLDAAGVADVRVPALVCMKDDAALAAALIADLESGDLFAHARLLLQPALRTHGDIGDALARMRARPDVAAAFAAHARVLPSQFGPALNSWHP